MKIALVSRTALALFLLGAGATAQAEAPAKTTGNTVTVSAAWVTETPPTARMSAAYLTLRNGARADTLLEVRTPVAGAAEMHETTVQDGLARMRQLKSLPLAPKQEVRFAPGGRHIMLIDLNRDLKAGDKVPLTLRFRHAGTVTVEADVRPMSADPMPHHMH